LRRNASRGKPAMIAATRANSRTRSEHRLVTTISDSTVQKCLLATILRRRRVIDNMDDFRALWIRSFGSSSKALPDSLTVSTSSTCWPTTWSSTSSSRFRTTRATSSAATTSSSSTAATAPRCSSTAATTCVYTTRRRRRLPAHQVCDRRVRRRQRREVAERALPGWHEGHARLHRDRDARRWGSRGLTRAARGG
jgi:hypothetical protein